MTMNQPIDFEVPANVRELAAKSVEQAKEAYGRIADATRQAQDMMLKSSEAMASGIKEMQEKAVQYTEANIAAGFDAAHRIVNARDMKEALEIQGQYARKQFETYASQAQEISRLVAQAAQKAQPNV
jgi:phasin